MSPKRAWFTDVRRRRLRVDVGTIITIGVLGQAALLIGLGYWGAQRIVGTLATSVHRADHQRVEDRIRAFLERGASVARTLAAAPHMEPAGPGAAQSAALMWALLAEARELDSLYVADEQGRMLMVLRYPQPAVRTIVRHKDYTSEHWAFKLPESESGDARVRFVTQRTEDRKTQYNPLARGWFRSAAATGQPVWTPPYGFDAARELGVTYAIPLPHADAAHGEPRLRVVATDVTLGRLADFVRQFSRAGQGDSALLSADGMVLARSDAVGGLQTLAPPQGGVLAALMADLKVQPSGDTGLRASVHGQNFLVQRSTLPSTGWTLVSWVPESRVLGGVRDAVLWGLAVALTFLALMLLISLRTARGITQPIERLAQIARRIGRLQLANLPRVDSRVLEVQHLDQALDESARGLQAFMKFVPVDIVSQLVAQGHALGPDAHPCELTIMFVDVRGFSHAAESMPAEQLVRQLTCYFNVAAEVIGRHGGTLDKFIGDGILVLWGAPTDLPDPALAACQAARELQQAMDGLNADWARSGLSVFPVGIGIHTGPVVAGVLGATDRLAYTALGDTVNVADRIEELNRQLGTRILISETTCAALAGRLPTRAIGAVPLRGRQAPLAVWELLEEAAPAGA